jgi:hypothetical protein
MVDVVDDHDVYKMRRRRETCCVSWVGPGYGIVVFCVFAACLMPITGSIESSLRGLLDLVCSSARLLVCSSILNLNLQNSIIQETVRKRSSISS